MNRPIDRINLYRVNNGLDTMDHDELEKCLLMLPAKHRNTMRRWINNGILPSGFVFAIISNDLEETVTLADDIEKTQIIDFVSFLIYHAPSGCYGGRGSVTHWHQLKLRQREG